MKTQWHSFPISIFTSSLSFFSPSLSTFLSYLSFTYFFGFGLFFFSLFFSFLLLSVIGERWPVGHAKAGRPMAVFLVCAQCVHVSMVSGAEFSLCPTSFLSPFLFFFLFPFITLAPCFFVYIYIHIHLLLSFQCPSHLLPCFCVSLFLLVSDSTLEIASKRGDESATRCLTGIYKQMLCILEAHK